MFNRTLNVHIVWIVMIGIILVVQSALIYKAHQTPDVPPNHAQVHIDGTTLIDMMRDEIAWANGAKMPVTLNVEKNPK